MGIVIFKETKWFLCKCVYENSLYENVIEVYKKLSDSYIYVNKL